MGCFEIAVCVVAVETIAVEVRGKVRKLTPHGVDIFVSGAYTTHALRILASLVLMPSIEWNRMY